MRKGADHIKICVSAAVACCEVHTNSQSSRHQTSGGVGSVTDAIDATQFTLEELQAITTTVKNMSNGRALVTAHCYTSEGIRHSIAVCSAHEA